VILILQQTQPIELSIIIMTATFWPSPPATVTCIFPRLLQQAIKSFEGFYLSRHSGRKLSWQPTLGSADMRITFKSKRHEVNVPTMCLVVLLLFEDTEEGDTLSYQVK